MNGLRVLVQTEVSQTKSWPLSPSCAHGEDGYGPAVPDTCARLFYPRANGTVRGLISGKEPNVRINLQDL